MPSPSPRCHHPRVSGVPPTARTSAPGARPTGTAMHLNTRALRRPRPPHDHFFAWTACGLQTSILRSRRSGGWLYTSALWFHAFKRGSHADYIDVLLNGPKTAPPGIGETTKANELALGIAPPEHVYMYLSSTDTEGGFGHAAFAIALLDFEGSVTPFDTGGLVEHIAPPKSWPEAERRKKFVESMTWPSTELPNLLPAYPGAAEEDWERYLAGDRPLVPGPHALWATSEAADIWGEAANEWPAWTWEGRRPAHIPIAHCLKYWTCPNGFFLELQDWVVKNPTFKAAWKELTAKHVEDGVGELLAKHRRGEIP